MNKHWDHSPCQDGALKQCVLDWNQTQTDYPRDAQVTQIFEQQVLSTPDAIALQDGYDTLSYQALNVRANQLAHFLKRQTVSERDTVVVCLPQGFDFVISLLAILKCNAVYVPLDVEYPILRIKQIVNDAGASCVITTSDYQAKLAPLKTQLVMLDDENHQIHSQPKTNISAYSSATDLAYIMYTSGTTGTPKGVMIPHRGIVRLVKNTNYIDIKPQHRIAQLANLAFDAATFEIWGALLNGASLVILHKKLLFSNVLKTFLIENKINIIFFTTAFLEKLAEQDVEIFNSIDICLFGGDFVNKQIIAELVNCQCQLIHVYGPTENTGFSVFNIVDRNALDQSKTIPIGVPIANTTAYVLGKNKMPVSLGEVGELYLGGDGLATGYFKDAKLTQERFMQYALANERLYKTGDLVRFLKNGQLEFVGRIDNQVKIRGFRVELEEIQKQLSLHPNILQVAVMPVYASTGDRKIVAFYRAHKTVHISLLRNWLKHHLPVYMIPEKFCQLSQFPLTTAGKVDQVAIRNQYQQTGNIVPIRSIKTKQLDVKQVLLDLWKEQFRDLNEEAVSVESDFYALGGDSLIAMQLATKAKSQNIQLSAEDILQKSTIQNLSLIVNHATVNQQDRKVSALAPIQSGLLYHTLQEESLYWIRIYFDIFDDLDVDRFRNAWQVLVSRHDILRASYVVGHHDEYEQLFVKNMVLPWTYLDWSCFDASKQLRLFEELREDNQYLMDLSKAPLFKVILIKLDSKKYKLFLLIHHLLIDGGSLQVLLNELFSIYHGSSETVLQKPLSYADFADWLAQLDLSSSKQFWQRYLEGFSDPTVLKLVSKRSLHKAYPDAITKSIEFTLTENISDKVRRFLKSQQITLSHLMQFAWATLLSRYSHQRDVVFGLVVALKAQFQGPLLGPVMNTLPMRVQFSDTTSVKQVLELVKQNTIKFIEHSYMPLHDIQKNSKFQNVTLFNTLLSIENYQSTPNERLKLGDICVDENNQYLLSMMVFPEAHLKFELTYDENTLEAEYVSQILMHFVNLVIAAIDDVSEPALTLPMLSHNELKHYQQQFKQTSLKSTEQTMVELFEAQVQKTPNNIALVYGSKKLSYDELNKKSNQFAHYLIDRGVKPGQIVGLCFNRSLEMMIAMLAILKAGAAYLPIDNKLPEKRKNYMVKECQARLVIAEGGLVHDCHAFVSNTTVTEVICYNYFSISRFSDKNPGVCLESKNLMYVIYTSGSTGKPKGVCITHSNLFQLMHSCEDVFQFSSSDVWTLFHSCAFDFSVWEIWGALLHGSQLVIPNEYTICNLSQYSSFIYNKNVSVLNVTPLEFFVIFEDNLINLSNVRYVIFGGDLLTQEQIHNIEKIQAFLKHTKFINMYGITENTIHTTCSDILLDAKANIQNIGKPLSVNEVCVVDTMMQVVPYGVQGELLISGPCVSRGYINSENVSNQKFIEAQCLEKKQRYLKTGDFVVAYGDGRLSYIGRMDDQVKLRGYRVSLNEISAVIDAHPSVSQSKVVKMYENEQAKIIAFIRLIPNSDPFDCKNYLSKYLPSYMLPNHIEFVDEFILNQNGKIDGSHLLHKPVILQDQTLSEIDQREIDPIIKIFAKLLGVAADFISADADFFELGGNSLLVCRLLNRINKQYAVDIKLSDFPAKLSANRLWQVISRRLALVHDRKVICA